MSSFFLRKQPPSLRPAVVHASGDDDMYDKYLYANNVLRTRMDAIWKRRVAENLERPEPVMRDVTESHNVLFHRTYRPHVAMGHEYVVCRPSGGAAASRLQVGSSTTATFAFPAPADFIGDMFFRVRFPVQTASGTTRYRYCAFPGVRMFERVELRVDGNDPIQSYETDDVVLKMRMEVLGGDLHDPWCAEHGQAIENTAETHANMHTAVHHFKEGPQTPKAVQPMLEMVPPLHFDCCSDPGRALFDPMLPRDLRRVVVTMAPLEKLIGAVDPYEVATTLDITSIEISIELYVHIMVVDPMVRDIVEARPQVRLIRGHQSLHRTLSQDETSVPLKQLRSPCEYLYFGVRDTANAADLDRWCMFGTPKVRTAFNRLLIPRLKWNSSVAAVELVARRAKTTGEGYLESVVDTIGLRTADGVQLVPELPPLVFSAYMPGRYGDHTIFASKYDPNAMAIVFGVHPGKFAPSGHLSFSAAGRQAELVVKGSTIAPGSEVELVVSSRTLNFVMRRDGELRLIFT